jgi:hypothetical protein
MIPSIRPDEHDLKSGCRHAIAAPLLLEHGPSADLKWGYIPLTAQACHPGPRQTPATWMKPRLRTSVPTEPAGRDS